MSMDNIGLKAKDCNSDHRMCICSVDHDKQLYFLEYEKTK